VTDAADTAAAARGGFPDVRPVDDAPPELGRFIAALRRLQDLTVSTNPGGTLWAEAAEHLETACAILDGHQVPETGAVAGRVLSIPGLAHPLMPPWTVTGAGVDGVTMAGHFTEAHVGGNRAVHGGIIPLLYDWLFGMTVTAADIRPTRTAFLNVDYRKITPINEPLAAHGTITEVDARKVFIAATMTAADGAVLSEANGLMVRLLPHQP
jgi:acyl-coenzyme A thioesterase PaaI-like protein